MIIPLDFCVTQGVIVVSVRIVEDGEKYDDGSFFIKDKSSRRKFVRLIGVEKLVLMVKG